MIYVFCLISSLFFQVHSILIACSSFCFLLGLRRKIWCRNNVWRHWSQRYFVCILIYLDFFGWYCHLASFTSVFQLLIFYDSSGVLTLFVFLHFSNVDLVETTNSNSRRWFLKQHIVSCAKFLDRGIPILVIVNWLAIGSRLLWKGYWLLFGSSCVWW